MAKTQCFIQPRLKGRFASIASVRKREFSMYCKKINASREISSHMSSTVVCEEKLGKCEEAEITWDKERRVYNSTH